MSQLDSNSGEAGAAAVAAPASPGAGRPAPEPKKRNKPVVSAGDRWFSGISMTAGIIIIVVLGAVALFLLYESWPAFVASRKAIEENVSFANGQSFWQFAGATMFGTILSSIIALAIAVPFSIAIALFISHYAPRKFASALGYIIDLLAAIPSVVFGLWGMRSLEPAMRPIFEWFDSFFTPILTWLCKFPPLGYMANRFDWWPITPQLVHFSPPARNILMGGLILAIMVLPIITSLCREVFLQTPSLLEEAAMGLGATRWEMIKMTVLPVGRSGIVSASMLGLGRALGETMALLMVLSAGTSVNFWIMSPGQHSTIASQIALKFPEAQSGLERQFLIGLGLLLFVLTFVVNFIARRIVAHYSVEGGKK